MIVDLVWWEYDERYHLYSWAREDEGRIGKVLNYFKRVFPIEKEADLRLVCFSKKSIEEIKVLH